MKVPFTWKVTGWFMIGRSAEFSMADVRPLRYFSEDLVVYRDESGELHLLSAHCRHLGTHIGHRARSSTIVSSVLFTACAGDPTAPTATSRISPIGPIVRCDYRCCPCASSTAACSCGISPTARIRSGNCRTSSTNSRSSRPTPTPTTGPIQSSPGAPRTSRCTLRSSRRTAPTAHTFTTYMARR